LPPFNRQFSSNNIGKNLWSQTFKYPSVKLVATTTNPGADGADGKIILTVGSIKNGPVKIAKFIHNPRYRSHSKIMTIIKDDKDNESKFPNFFNVRTPYVSYFKTHEMMFENYPVNYDQPLSVGTTVAVFKSDPFRSEILYRENMDKITDVIFGIIGLIGVIFFLYCCFYTIWFISNLAAALSSIIFYHAQLNGKVKKE
jgi:hypothetical protein